MGDKECRDLEKCFKRTPNKKDSKNSAKNNNASFRKRLDYNASADLVHGDRDCQEMAAATATLAKTTLGLEHPSAQSLPQYDDVYHSISQVNGMINRMDLSTMKKRCAELNLHPMGKREAVKRRLKEYYKETMLIEAGLIDPRENRNVDVFVVIDFEATCGEAKDIVSQSRCRPLIHKNSMYFQKRGTLRITSTRSSSSPPSWSPLPQARLSISSTSIVAQ